MTYPLGDRISQLQNAGVSAGDAAKVIRDERQSLLTDPAEIASRMCQCGHSKGGHQYYIPYKCCVDGCDCERFRLDVSANGSGRTADLYATPVTACVRCRREVTDADVCCSDASYIMIGGVAYWPIDGDVCNAWDVPVCGDCCGGHGQRGEYSWDD